MGLVYEPKKGSPLCKLDNYKFIEGYWTQKSSIDDTKKTILKYKLPLIGDELVDPKFLTKFKHVMENSNQTAISAPQIVAYLIKQMVVKNMK